jgi:outer membrane protein TolC
VDWGKRREVKFQRQMQISMAIQNVEAVREKVMLDARRAFYAYKKADEELALAREIVQVREEAEKQAKTPQEQLNTRSASAKAMLELMQAEVNHRLEHVKLCKSIGQP